VPVPPEAYVSAPGLAFASCEQFGMLPALTPDATTSTVGEEASCTTGVDLARIVGQVFLQRRVDHRTREIISRVWPSGAPVPAARYDDGPAPGRLSTTTCWPRPRSVHADKARKSSLDRWPQTARSAEWVAPGRPRCRRRQPAMMSAPRNIRQSRVVVHESSCAEFGIRCRGFRVTRTHCW